MTTEQPDPTWDFDAFAHDLNEAAEAWFAYADAHFGKPQEVTFTHPTRGRLRRMDRRDQEEATRAHGAFLDGFMHSRGWRQDEKHCYLKKVP